MFCFFFRSSVLPVSYFSEIHSVSQFKLWWNVFFCVAGDQYNYIFLARCTLAPSSGEGGKQSSRIRKFLMSYFHAQQIEKRRGLLLVSSVFFFIYINFFFSFFPCWMGKFCCFSEICSIFFLCLRHKLLIMQIKRKMVVFRGQGGGGEAFGEHKHGILSLKNDVIFFCIYHFIIYYYNNRGQFLFCLIFWKAKSDEILLLFFFSFHMFPCVFKS